MTDHVVHASDPRLDLDDITSFYRHGWHSWSPTGWVDPAVPVTPIPDEGRRLGHDDPTIAFDTRVSASSVGVALDDGRATLLGALAPDARVRPDGATLVGSCEAGPIDWLVAEGTVSEVFATYAHRLGEALGTRPRRAMRVWCSWYSYYEGITEAAMARELDAIGPLAFDVVQIDDGWQVGIGDWEPNDDFPSGMVAAARRIRETERTAGLWLAPYIARADSRLAAERPELLLRREDGSPVVSGINWGGPYYSLDPTAAGTDAFVTETIERVRSWGFDYLKLDFLYGAAFPGSHERPMPRESAYRHGLRTIRRAAGDDCYLLACGSPVIASIGIVDGIRIGPDVAEFWEEAELTAMGDYSGRGARNAIITTSERMWLRDVVDVDPDVAFFDRSAVALDERTLASLRDLAAITGFVGTSDHIADLDGRERDELESLLNHRPEVRRASWLAWHLDDRTIDFSWAHRTPTTETGRTP
jgi:alpha-galactosidase